MSLNQFLQIIQDSPIAHAVSKSNHLVGAALQVVHVAGFLLLLAGLILISLRILGIVLTQQRLADVTEDASKLVWWGLGLAASSGLLMFVATPTLYAYKWAFQLKLVLFAVAVILQLSLFRKVANTEATHAWLAKGTVVTSLLVWFSVGYAGRMIGFI